MQPQRAQKHTPEPPNGARLILHTLVDALTGRHLFWVLLLALGVAVVSGLLGFRVQTTESGPRGIYRFVETEIERGSLVIACPPPMVVLLGKRRGYLQAGPCDGRVAPVLKTVAAVAGDTVTLERAGLAVNGIPIEGTAVLQRDSEGRALPHPRWGEHRVEEGQVWLLSTYTPKSFDSRYFGPVPVSRVLAVAEGVLTEVDFARDGE